MKLIDWLLSDPTLVYLTIPLVKVAIIFVVLVGSVPVLVLFERKLIGFIQQRPGPNRVGPWGILQTLVDGIKLLLKEDFIPPGAVKPIFILAPLLALVPAMLSVTIIPWGPPIQVTIDGIAHTISLGLADGISVGILFYFAATSIGVYGIVLAGWSSNNKYSLLGGIRSTAQLISYELALSLGLVGVLLLVGSFEINALVDSQAGGFWNWNVVKQPMGFLMFLVAGFGETNRLPFDLPEGESELGAGFHTEYSSMRFAMFFMAEYMNIFTFSAVISTLFLGGFHGPIDPALLGIEVNQWIAAAFGVFWLGGKIIALFFLFVWIRATFPRLRYDQMMNLSWKVFFPLGVVNIMLTAGIVAFAPDQPAVQTGALFVAGIAQIVGLDAIANAAKRRALGHVS